LIVDDSPAENRERQNLFCLYLSGLNATIAVARLNPYLRANYNRETVLVIFQIHIKFTFHVFFICRTRKLP